MWGHQPSALQDGVVAVYALARPSLPRYIGNNWHSALKVSKKIEKKIQPTSKLTFNGRCRLVENLRAMIAFVKLTEDLTERFSLKKN